MSAILLVGAGPLPASQPRRMGFPQLRTQQLTDALRDAGHRVAVAALGEGDLDPSRPGWRRRVADLGRGAEVVVTAGPFLPLAVGATVAGERPLWADVPGDPMAEAQLRAWRSGDEGHLARYREGYAAALARADRFSVTSPDQRLALLGALGLTGRLVGAATGRRWVDVVPICFPPAPAPRDPPWRVEKSDFVVLISGGWNTWADGDTLLAALLAACARLPRLRVVVTGGRVQAHEHGVFDRFARGARSSRFAARFDLLGWVTPAQVEATLRRADCALSLDLPCLEAELGGRTRLIEASSRGVPVVATALPQPVRDLRGWAGFTEVPPVDVEAVVGALVDRAAGPRRVTPPPAPEAPCAPLLSWVARPDRAPRVGGMDEAALLRAELEGVYASPTWRALARVHRLLRRDSWA